MQHVISSDSPENKTTGFDSIQGENDSTQFDSTDYSKLAVFVKWTVAELISLVNL